ncbi:MAG: polysaccharide lyase family 7 protein [Verrucomicrobiota bacterium]
MWNYSWWRPLASVFALMVGGSSVSAQTEAPSAAGSTNRAVTATLPSDAGQSSVPSFRKPYPPPYPYKTKIGDIFRLDVWKLTLPIDDDANGKPDEVVMPNLHRFEDPEFFYMNDAFDGVRFRAPVGGVTTENSHYPRTELREMDPGGEERASWGTNDGKTHTLVAILAFTEVPKEKPHLCAVQIHDGKDDVLQLRIEERKVFLERDGADDFLFFEDYELGAFFEIMIISDEGRIRLFKDQKQVLIWETEREGCYFKAGAYVQSNPEKGDDPETVGEVVFRKLWIRHK